MYYLFVLFYPEFLNERISKVFLNLSDLFQFLYAYVYVQMNVLSKLVAFLQPGFAYYRGSFKWYTAKKPREIDLKK